MIKLFEKFFDVEFSDVRLAKINSQIKMIEEQYYKERILCGDRTLSPKGERHFERTERQIEKLEKKASRERQKQFRMEKGRTR